MDMENTSASAEALRQQMIEFITKAIQQTDDRRLRNIYNFVLHIQ